MTGFEPRTSGVGSDRSTNCTTTTALTPMLGSLIIKRFFLIFSHPGCLGQRLEGRPERDRLPGAESRDSKGGLEALGTLDRTSGPSRRMAAAARRNVAGKFCLRCLCTSHRAGAFGVIGTFVGIDTFCCIGTFCGIGTLGGIGAFGVIGTSGGIGTFSGIGTSGGIGTFSGIGTSGSYSIHI